MVQKYLYDRKKTHICVKTFTIRGVRNRDRKKRNVHTLNVFSYCTLSRYTAINECVNYQEHSVYGVRPILRIHSEQ